MATVSQAPPRRVRRSRRRAAGVAPRRVALLALLALLPGCAFFRPLPPAALRARLAAAARTPGELGVTLEPQGTGFRLYPVYLPAEPGPAELAFARHRPAAAATPVVRAAVNGRPARALLDTGAAASLIDPYGAMRLGVVPLRRAGAEHAGADGLLTVRGRGLGQTFEQVTGLAEELRLGEAALRRVPFAILDRSLARRGWAGGLRVDVLVGADVFRAFGRVAFDFPRARVLLGPAESAPGATRVAEAALVGDGPVPVIRADIQGLGERAVAIDTGGDFSLWLPPEWAAEVPVMNAASGPPFRRGQGVGGPVSTLSAGDRTVTLGGVRFERVASEIGLGRPGGAAPLPYALLGRGFLRRYRVTVDYASRRVLLER